jgi:serine/threonine-protein kinase
MEKTPEGKILHYHLAEKIGSGFAGDIYHAWDSGLDRNVVIRIIKKELAQDTSFCAQVMTTGLAARNFLHPHVARFYGAEEVDGQLLIVTEYIQGMTLKSIVSQKPLHFQEFLKLSHELTDALKAIHQQNIRHQYITSDNVIITSDGSAKLTDLGIAPTSKMMRISGHLISSDKLVYLAPELLQGQDPTQISDQYSLGVVLFEALTGNLPYEESSREQLIKMIETPDSLKKSFEEIEHGDIYLLITKMTATLPEDRFSSMDELIATVKEIDISQNDNKRSPHTLHTTSSALKSRFYLIISLAFFLLVLFWLIVKGSGG